MSLQLKYQRYILNFKFDAGTSRGVLNEKETYFLKIFDSNSPEKTGIGESGPLKKLSIDDIPDFEDHLIDLSKQIKGYEMPTSVGEIYELAESLVPPAFPAIRFGLEVALLDLFNGGNRLIYDNDFAKGRSMPINGLIWMGHTESMLKQITDKVEQGYDCIKLKIGSLDFEKECDILEYVRNKYYSQPPILRVDANGAFRPEEALEKLTTLSKFDIHSIEQPIMAGQHKLMRDLCAATPLPIALDEELIGIHDYQEKKHLLEYIKPQFIILKPTLLGGIQSTIEWISIADELQIGWWFTSALESNIGLNAICQLTYDLEAKGHQGLGTGQLYHNNIESPLQISNGHISYQNNLGWNLSQIS